MLDSALRRAKLYPEALAGRIWKAERRQVHRRDPRRPQRPLVWSPHAAKVRCPGVSSPVPKEEERRPEPGNSFQNRQDPIPGGRASWPPPGSSKHQAPPRWLSFCRGREPHVRNQRNLNPEKGSIPSKGPFATLSPSQFPDPTAVRGNRENARETNFRTLPG